MKKYLYIVSLLTVFLIATTGAQAQEQKESLRDRLAKRAQQEQQLSNGGGNLPGLSLRAQMRNKNSTQDLSNATWVREVYRFLDLTKGPDAALYYPETPIGDRINFYTLIFRLMAEGRLDVYDFNDNQPIFTEKFRVSPADMFERLEIPFSQDGDLIVYDELNIPSNDVLGYYIKEVWYFDQPNSVLDVKVVAICPVLFRNVLEGFDIDFSSEAATREPQFWIPYENIRPYAARMPIMTSNLNNILDKTVDDFFVLRLYDGEIYKATNMENKYLIEQYKTPEELEHAREKIEEELQDFEKGLWVISDSVKVSDGAPKKRKIKDRDQPKSSSDNSATYSARERRTKF